MSCCGNPLIVDDVCVVCGAGFRTVQPKRGGRKPSAVSKPEPSRQVHAQLANVELVELNPADLKYIGRVASARLSAKLPNTNKLESVTRTHSELQLHRLGVTAKVAFSKAFGLEFNETISTRGDQGYDAVLPDGRTVRIKSRDKMGADLITAKNEIVADVVVLSEIVTPDVVRQVGWITRDEFYAACTLHDFGHGMRQIVRRKKLRPMLTILNPARAVAPATPQGRLL